jgi:hypothetical protein
MAKGGKKSSAKKPAAKRLTLPAPPGLAAALKRIEREAEEYWAKPKVSRDDVRYRAFARETGFPLEPSPKVGEAAPVSKPAAAVKSRRRPQWDRTRTALLRLYPTRQIPAHLTDKILARDVADELKRADREASRKPPEAGYPSSDVVGRVRKAEFSS